MKHEHNYEEAYYHYRPEFMLTGRRNIARYTLTGNYTNGEYFILHLNNKDEVEHYLAISRNSVMIEPDSIAMQNEFGQLMWNSETGFTDDLIHPKYMDRMECMKPSFWRHASGF